MKKDAWIKICLGRPLSMIMVLSVEGKNTFVAQGSGPNLMDRSLLPDRSDSNSLCSGWKGISVSPIGLSGG